MPSQCNEAVPCNNCVRHGVQCSLSHAIRQSPPRISTAPYRTLDAVNSERPAQASALQTSDTAALSAASEPQEISTTSILQMKINKARQLMLDVYETLDSSRTVSNVTPSGTADSPDDEHEHELYKWSVRDQMQSLRLLHHYYTSAYSLLSHEPATAELWQTTVPEMAFNHVRSQVLKETCCSYVLILIAGISDAWHFGAFCSSLCSHQHRPA